MKLSNHLLSFPRQGAIPFLFMLCATVPIAEAAELGIAAQVEMWPTLPKNFNVFTTGGTGIVGDTKAEQTFRSHAAASFHTLAVAGSATGQNTGQFYTPVVGGTAYWFDQITISSPGVPTGTIGTADFTLFFEGKISTGPPVATLPTPYFAELEYGLEGTSDQPDGRPSLVSEAKSRRITVFSSYTEIRGPEFYLNQPNHHQLTFRFGQPTDFTIWISAYGKVWQKAPSKVNMSLRLTGWNGFNNIRIRNGAAVSNAVIGSQTTFNYGNAGTISFEQWAGLFQVGSDPANLLKYALGRDPLATGGADPYTRGTVMLQGVEYPTLVFKRPILGARPSDITYTPERNTLTGEGWSPNGMVTEAVPDGMQQETVTVRSTAPLGSLDSEFMRLRVSKP